MRPHRRTSSSSPPSTGAGGRYDAFISYSHAHDMAVAEALQTEVERYAKPWYRPRGLRLFRDTTNLAASPHLWPSIRAALEVSDWFILMASQKAAASEWVADEVEWWLRERSTDHILIALTDGDVLWSGQDFDWEATDALPPTLAGRFRAQPRWVDLRPVVLPPLARSRIRPPKRKKVSVGDLAAEFAAPIRGVPKDQLVGRHIRERRRTRRTVIAVITVLLLVSIAATTGFIRAATAQRTAEANARQAQAQADAAEALLTVSNLPTVGIDRALRAASESASPTVRSAMLAVSQSTRRLVRAFPDAGLASGAPSTSVAFSEDGSKLLAWGNGSARTSSVQLWDIATGRAELTDAASASTVRDLAVVSDREVAGCSDDGPVLLQGSHATVRLLGGGGSSHPPAECRVVRYAQGVIVLASGDGGGTAYVFDRLGHTSEVDGVKAALADPRSDVAALSGSAGLTLVSGTRTTAVVTSPNPELLFADEVGDFVTAGSGTWGTVMQSADGPQLHTSPVPPTAAEVAPVLSFDRMTGELAWIDDDGTVGWTVDGHGTQLQDSQGDRAWSPFQPKIVPLAYGDFVAVYRNTAIVLRAPSVDHPADAPSDILPTGSTEWTQTVVKERLGTPGSGSTDPVLARCSSNTAVLLRTDAPEGGALFVQASGETRRLTSHGQFTEDCAALDTGPTLTMQPRVGDPIPLQEAFIADDVAPSPKGDAVAVVKAGFPIEVLSTVPSDSLPRPWDVTDGPPESVTSFGEREVLVEPSGDVSQLVVAKSSGGVVSRTPLPDWGELAASRPDGAGGVVRRSASAGALLVTGDKVAPAAYACTGLPISYRPARGFQRSRRAAEAQVPTAVAEDGSILDCQTGRRMSVDADVQVLSYDLDETSGRIIWRSNGAVTVTTWARSAKPSAVTSEQGPAAPANEARVAFDRSARTAVVYSPGTRELSVYRRTGGGRWQATLRLAPNLPDVVAAEVPDEGTLVLAVDSTGGFEMFDASTGRLVASDPTLAETFSSSRISAISVRRVGDDLDVGLQADGASYAFATIRIPITEAALRRQLCSLYRSELC